MLEEFKDIAGYEGLYQVSNLGRVKSLGNNKTRREKILKSQADERGYQQVILCKEGKHKKFSVHRLVALEFLPKPIDPKATEVNHKDENKTNNVVVLNADDSVNVEQTNLEWCTREYNTNYGTRTERAAKAKSKPVLQFTKSGEFIKEWTSTYEVQRVLGISCGNISKCCSSKRNSSGGFVWKYKTA